MKYSKELHDKLRNRTGLHIFNHQIGLDSEDIDALLDEIDRLIEDNTKFQEMATTKLAHANGKIEELTATKHSQAFRNAELSRFVWWVYQVYARNVQELTSGITEACTYDTEEKAEKGKYGLPIRCWEYVRYLEEYTAGIYNGTYLDSETSTGVKSPPAGHWKSQACIATKRMLELTAFLRKIMLLGLLRGSPRLRDEALRILDGFEASTIDGSDAQDVLINNETSPLIEKTSTDNNKCMWVMVEDPDIDLWCTSCGEEFHLEADSPSDNHMKYCCYCGKEITEG